MFFFFFYKKIVYNYWLQNIFGKTLYIDIIIIIMSTIIYITHKTWNIPYIKYCLYLKKKKNKINKNKKKSPLTKKQNKIKTKSRIMLLVNVLIAGQCILFVSNIFLIICDYFYQKKNIKAKPNDNQFKFFHFYIY